MASSQSASSQLRRSRAVSRRAWLAQCATVLSAIAVWPRAVGAQQLPPGVGMAATPPCDPSTKPTPARSPQGFRAGAPLRTRLIESAPGGRELLVTGAVIGLRCGFIPGATVDVWHADANGAVSAAGTRWRGRQLTDAGGRYRVETIVPGAPVGQAPRLNLRVHVPGKATLTTMVFLPDSGGGARNSTDKAFDPLLAMTLIDQTPARVTASFNVILDL